VGRVRTVDARWRVRWPVPRWLYPMFTVLCGAGPPESKRGGGVDWQSFDQEALMLNSRR